MKKFTHLLVVIIAMISFAELTLAEDQKEKALAGQPFGDSEVVQEMESSWQEKKIQYDTDKKNIDLVVVLNQQFYEFMLPYVNEFARKRNVTIDVIRGTCGISSGKLSKKTGDVGGFCCPPGKSDRLPGLRFHSVGIHPLAIIVHPDNPINDISSKELRKVFQGKITNWSDLGGDNGTIMPAMRLHCKKRPGHWRLILDNEDLFGPAVRDVGSVEDMFLLVGDEERSIGYEVLWLSNRKENKVKSLTIDGFDPDNSENVLRGDYPFYRSLYLTTWEPDHLKKPLAKELVDYVIKQVSLHGEIQGIISVEKLKDAGWRFSVDELIGEPE